jgi:hypothetical protein
VKSNVADDNTIDDDLMNPPGRSFIDRALRQAQDGACDGLMCRHRHGDCIHAVGQRIFRVPLRSLRPVARSRAAQVPGEQPSRKLD